VVLLLQAPRSEIRRKGCLCGLKECQGRGGGGSEGEGRVASVGVGGVGTGRGRSFCRGGRRAGTAGDVTRALGESER